MSRPVLKKNWSLYLELAICVSITLIMVLTAVNISSFLSPKKVLGIKTADEESSAKTEFWTNFLAKNPNYIPGLIETGQVERAKEVDPNYVIP